MTRICAKLNPPLWEAFLERRRQLGEPAPNSNDWTTPMVNAWMDVRKPRVEQERNWAAKADHPSEKLR